MKQRTRRSPQAFHQPDPSREVIRATQNLCWRATDDFRRGQYAEAAAKFQQAMRDCPGLRDTHLMLGRCYYALGRLEEAANEANMELKADPRHGSALDLLGVVRLDQGQPDEALAALEQAQKFQPDDPDIARHLHLARIRVVEKGRVQIAVGQDPPSHWPSISVCMIVRNEEKTLDRCLTSLGDLATQLIIVDTGSQDRTVEIARKYGAEVYHFRWIDDFAAARNESLKPATGDWIFWIDADDELSPEGVAQVKNAASGQADAYGCQIVSNMPDGAQQIGIHMRLFRNGLGLRFHGQVHETVYPDIVAQRARLVDTDIRIVHHGYEADPAILREKARRNLAYLEREQEKRPDSSELLSYIGFSHYGMGNLAQAEETLRQALRAPRAGFQFELMRFWSWVCLATVYQDQGQLQAMQDALAEALREFPSHPYLLAAQGMVALKRHQAAEAVSWLEAAYTQDNASVQGMRPNRQALALNLAACYGVLGDAGQEAGWFARTGTVQKNGLRTYLLWAENRLQQGKPIEALSVLEAARRHWPRHQNVWKGLALAYEQMGRPTAAYGAWTRAVGYGLSKEEARPRMSAVAERTVTTLDADTSDSSLLGQGILALQAGQFVDAVACFSEVVEASPEDTVAYRHLAVALQKIGREEDALHVWRVAKSVGMASPSGG